MGVKTKPFRVASLHTDLMQAIQRGELKPGERLPPFRTLASQYKVSLNTVQRVIGELVEAKVLETTQGRGTFVSSARRLGAATEFAVGIYARASGHFFGDMYECMRESLVRAGATPILFDPNSESLDFVRSTRLRELVGGQPAALIVDGAIGTNAALGDASLARRLARMAPRVRDLVVVNRWEYEQRLPGSYFLFDYEGAGVQIAQYLYSLGHRYIAMNTYGNPVAPNAFEDDVLRGMRRFMNDQNEALRIEFFREPEAGKVVFDTERFKQLFTAARRPTAVVLVADYMARLWFERLHDLGLRVPKDISLIGFYNTPHAASFPVGLTSVQLNFENMVLRAINHIVSGKDAEAPPRESERIGASLVLRESCGPPNVSQI